MIKVLNNTSIDEKALHLNLFREKNEDIDSFSERVNEAFEKAFELKKESFYESLDYLTSKRSILLFEISPNKDYELFNIKFDGVFLKCFNNLNEEINSIEILNEKKFALNFKETFQTQLGDIFTLKSYIDNSFEKKYLLSENIVPFHNLKHRFNFKTKESSLNTLNDKNVVEIADYRNRFNQSVTLGINTNNRTLRYTESLETISNSPNEYYVKDQTFLKNTIDEENVFYNYVEWPLRIYWNECKAFEFNSDSFDYRIKNKVKINQDDQDEKPYFLSQKGAKLINQLLKLDNTYWGK